MMAERTNSALKTCCLACSTSKKRKTTEISVFRIRKSFWASWIRIRNLFVRTRFRVRILTSNKQQKNWRKTLISTVLWLLYEFLSLNNDVDVSSKSNKHREKNNNFCWRVEGHWRKEQDPEPEKIRIRVSSGSVPKCHGTEHSKLAMRGISDFAGFSVEIRQTTSMFAKFRTQSSNLYAEKQSKKKRLFSQKIYTDIFIFRGISGNFFSSQIFCNTEKITTSTDRRDWLL